MAADITVTFKGNSATVKHSATDSVTVETDGAHIHINSTYKEHRLRVVLKGKSTDGQLILKTAGKAQVRLEGLDLTSQEGAPIWLKNKKRVEIVAAKGTENTLAIEACRDTANQKGAVIFSKDKLRLSGKGTLHVLAKGDGCKGIHVKDDLEIEELVLDVVTTGNNLGEEAFGGGMPGGFGPHMGGFGRPGGFDPEQLSDEEKAHFEQMRAQFEQMRARFEEMREKGELPQGGPFGGGGFGPNPFNPNDSTRRGAPFGGGGFGPNPFTPNDSTRQGSPFGGFGGGFGPNSFNPNDSTRQGGPFGGFGGGFGGPMKRNYVGTAKGIKALGKITMSSGTVSVQTNSPGAEGIEGKQGIEMNGGVVSVVAVDDAINANAPICFSGAHVTARSTTNDAIDANDRSRGFMPFGMPGQQQDAQPMIVVTGGTVYAWSQIGPPEEGLDCDFSPIEIAGGTVFSAGAGMGDMPSVPNAQTAKQPTLLLIGLNIAKDEPICLLDSQSKEIGRVCMPFDLQHSSSLISFPQLEVGQSYTLRTKGYEKKFNLTEPFTIVR